MSVPTHHSLLQTLQVLLGLLPLLSQQTDKDRHTGFMLLTPNVSYNITVAS